MTQAPSPDQPSDQVRPDAGSQARSEARPVRLRPALDGVPTYRPGKPPTPVEGVTHFKLSSNENPYPPLPSVLDAIADAASHVHRYPDPGVHGLRERIAAELGVGPDEIVVGPGSAAVYDQIVQALVDDGDEVVYSWRSFELYPICVAARGGRSVQVPNTAEGRHDLPAMARSIRRDTRLVIVCSPNNPTGATVGAAELEDFLARVPAHVAVLLDEAYLQFDTSGDRVDGLDAYRRHPNVVLLRTFSKAYGLAGLRVGYAVAHPRVAAALAKTGLPFAVTDVAQQAALASLDAAEELDLRVKSVLAERGRVQDALRDQGWDLPESHGNFVWLPLAAESLAFGQIADAAGISVRPFDGDGVRVTIGEPAANDVLIRVCREAGRPSVD